MILIKDGRLLIGFFIVVDLDALKSVMLKDSLVELISRITVPKLM